MSTDTNSVTVRIKALNAAQFGSFGEYVFASIAEATFNKPIESWHYRHTDYFIDGRQIDVKSYRLKKEVRLKPYIGRRREGIDYAKVEFFEDRARVSLEDRLLRHIELPELEHLFERWVGGKKIRAVSSPKPTQNDMLRPIMRDIREFFALQKLKARVIYRTCQADWNHEPPGNLVGQKRGRFDVHIFLDFVDTNISLQNLNQVVAIPETCVKDLQADRHHLNLDKIDHRKLPRRFLFKDVHDLKENYFKLS